MDMILIFAGLLLASAFFSSSEIAFFSLSELHIRHLVELKRRNADLVARLKADPHRLLITILIGNTVINLAAGSIATIFAIERFGSQWVGLATGVTTFFVLVFGEITPKSLATRHAERIAFVFAKPILFLTYLFFPLIWALDVITRGITRIFGKTVDSPTVTEEELMHIVKVGAEEGEIKKTEKEMIHNIFEFDDTLVREIMVPRRSIVAIDINDTKERILSTLKKSKYSRVLVHDGTLDTIRGVLFVKDLFIYLDRKLEKSDIERCIRKAFIIPETKPIDLLLRDFQKQKTHIAIVVDEHGSVAGLVTIEDLLEEIVGEIYDEKDLVAPAVKRISDTTAQVDGSIDIATANRKLGLDIQWNEGYMTLGGLVLAKLGRLPKEGEKVGFKNFEIEIEGIEENRITSMRVIKSRKTARRARKR